VPSLRAKLLPPTELVCLSALSLIQRTALLPASAASPAGRTAGAAAGSSDPGASTGASAGGSPGASAGADASAGGDGGSGNADAGGGGALVGSPGGLARRGLAGVDAAAAGVLTGVADPAPLLRLAPGITLSDFTAVAQLVFAEAAAFRAAAAESGDLVG
jgi:hypothetical protein